MENDPLYIILLISILIALIYLVSQVTTINKNDNTEEVVVPTVATYYDPWWRDSVYWPTYYDYPLYYNYYSYRPAPPGTWARGYSGRSYRGHSGSGGRGHGGRGHGGRGSRGRGGR